MPVRLSTYLKVIFPFSLLQSQLIGAAVKMFADPAHGSGVGINGLLTLALKFEQTNVTLIKFIKLSKAEVIGWEWVSKRDSVTTAEYEEAMELPNRTAKNHIQKMKKLGLLKMTGSGRATRYKVIRQ